MSFVRYLERGAPKCAQDLGQMSWLTYFWAGVDSNYDQCGVKFIGRFW